MALLYEAGASMPDGKGIPVCQVEASIRMGGIEAWMLDPSMAVFKDKTIRDMTGTTKGIFSSHATGVGRLFYENGTSMASGVDDVDFFAMGHWVQGGGLRFGSALKPAVHECRVANHSWVGAGLKKPAQTAELLRRLDWWIEQDEYLHIVGLGNNTGVAPPLLASAFNVISVGRSDASHSRQTSAVDALYTKGRVRPDLVAPVTSTSAAAPIVAGAAVILLETAKNHPELSTDLQQTGMTTRAGVAVSNAGRAETIRAVLMAGADRLTRSGKQGAAITDYRQDKANQTANGLDVRYGAGQLNIQQSYRILMAGEQNSSEDGGPGVTRYQGFDYDPAFGGEGNSNTVATYPLPAVKEKTLLSVALIWHLRFSPDPAVAFPGVAELHDLNLELVDVTGPTIVERSSSTEQNSENLWCPLMPGQSYALRVLPATGSTAFLQDFAIAWSMQAEGK